MLRIILISLIMILLVVGCTEQKADTENVADNKIVPGEINYSVPGDWKSVKPKGQMRKAQYKIPGIEGAADGEMAVFVFPGTGGSVRANVDRWIAQFVQPDGSDSKERSEIKSIVVNDLRVTTMYVTGTYFKSSSQMMMGGPKEELPNYAMLAAIVETSKDPWFFKFVGPQKTVDHWRPEFDKFVNSFK
jgi:hypothetical protein